VFTDTARYTSMLGSTNTWRYLGLRLCLVVGHETNLMRLLFYWMGFHWKGARRKNYNGFALLFKIKHRKSGCSLIESRFVMMRSVIIVLGVCKMCPTVLEYLGLNPNSPWPTLIILTNCIIPQRYVLLSHNS